MHSLIFFGSDQYSTIVLSALFESKIWSQITIITDRPKPVGKVKIIEPSEVEKLAITHNLKISYYPSNKDEMITFISMLKSWFVDTLNTGLCASFDHLLPANIIDLFAGNLYNLHPSLLPQYRNVSPVQYAIALGDEETGITLFRISSGIDNGQIIAQVSESILSDDTTSTLTPRLFKLGADLFLRSDLVGCKLDQKPTRSDLVGVPLIFTHRLTRESGYIEWGVLQKLLRNESITPSDTTNELLKLRLQKIESSGLEFGAWNLVLSDLSRSLYPWPGVWSTAQTKKGDLRLSLESVVPTISVKLAGKPKPISLSDFTLYYL